MTAIASGDVRGKMFSDRNTTQKLLPTFAPRAVVLLRLAISFIFVTEGIQKFLFPDALGVGRFMRIGIPSPETVAPAVAIIEIACGAAVLFGLATRFAAFALVIDMLVALAATKVPILLGHGFLGFADPKGATGFWAFAHEARLDLAMLLGCAMLVAIGPGAASLDHRMTRRAR